MKIALVGARNNEEEFSCTHWSGLDRTLKESEHDHYIFCCRQGIGFIKEIIQWQPDLIIYGLIDMAKQQEWREQVRDGCPNAKIVFWYGDARTPETGQIDPVDLSGTVDLFLASNDGLKWFQKKHFGMTPEYMPLAVYPTEKPVFSQKTLDTYGDFVFIGAKANRIGFVKRMNVIQEIEDKLGLRVINGGNRKERAMVYKSMPKIYGSAKFSLEISHFWDIHKYTSNRFWVIPGYWGFSLSKRFPGCEELYPEDTRVYWNTVDELREKIEYYTKNNEERLRMIEKGHQHTVDNHTYKHRINSIIEML